MSKKSTIRCMRMQLPIHSHTPLDVCQFLTCLSTCICIYSLILQNHFKTKMFLLWPSKCGLELAMDNLRIQKTHFSLNKLALEFNQFTVLPLEMEGIHFTGVQIKETNKERGLQKITCQKKKQIQMAFQQ